MRFGRKGAMGEGILMIYRLVLVSLIAVVILGLSSVFYAHYIDVRDAEARVLAREVVGCLAPSGVVDLGKISEVDRRALLLYCGFDEGESERFYVGAWIFNSSGKNVANLSYGDSGALWVRKLFEVSSRVERIKKYEPGYFAEDYPVVLNSDGKSGSWIELEVLVNG